MEKVLTMVKTKSKSVIIDGDVHGRFKLFCKGKNYKIGGVIEQLIETYMDNYKTIQDLIESENIIE